MSIKRKSMLMVGTLILVAMALWLGSLYSTFRLNQRQILFEFGQMSSWTLATGGFFIDSEGNVYTYSNDSLNPNPLKKFSGDMEKGELPYTTNDLFKFYGNSSQVVGTIDAKMLKEMVNLIQSASMGELTSDDPLTLVNCESQDAGIYTYRAYLYDSIRKTHTPVYLYTMGDIKLVNLSQEGKILHKWLEATCIENDYFANCKPSQHICRP